MRFHKVVVNPSIFMEYIRLGHSFCHVYKNDYRSNSDFLYTYFVNVDVDGSSVSLTEFLKRPVMKPTLAYTTFSNMLIDGYRYRLIYCFSEKIDFQTYSPLYSWICSYIGLSDTQDNCGKTPAQLMNGNSLPDIECYLSNRIYDISDFVQKSHLQLYCGGDNMYYNPKRLNCKKEFNINDSNNKIITDLN